MCYDAIAGSGSVSGSASHLLSSDAESGVWLTPDTGRERRTAIRSLGDGPSETLSAPAEGAESGSRPELSVVVTLFQEQATLDELHARLTTTLEGFGRTYEVLYVDDGSTDGTFASLQRIHEGDDRVRAVRLKRNSGQHPAMHAGLSRARGAIVVTMDGDLQNPPEDVPRLVEAVGGLRLASVRRAARHDSWGPIPSRMSTGSCALTASTSRTSGAFTPTGGPVEPCSARSGGRSSRGAVLGGARRRGRRGMRRGRRLALPPLAHPARPALPRRSGRSRSRQPGSARTLCSLASLARGGYALSTGLERRLPRPAPPRALVGSLVLGVQASPLLVGEHLGRIHRVSSTDLSISSTVSFSPGARHRGGRTPCVAATQRRRPRGDSA